MGLSHDGFECVRGVFAHDEVEAWIQRLGPVTGAGRRGLMAEPEVRALALSPKLRALMSDRLGAPARPVRAIYFDKSPETNWLVAWHQDLSIAVADRADVPGFGPWSVKEGVTHVQPPGSLLEQMLTIRLHLDDCDVSNGALQVIAGSHRHGKLSAEQIAAFRSGELPTVCELRAGDALLMRPLLLHASGRSESDGHRRVLHIEYAAFDLPAPLRWHEA